MKATIFHKLIVIISSTLLLLSSCGVVRKFRTHSQKEISIITIDSLNEKKWITEVVKGDSVIVLPEEKIESVFSILDSDTSIFEDSIVTQTASIKVFSPGKKNGKRNFNYSIKIAAKTIVPGFEKTTTILDEKNQTAQTIQKEKITQHDVTKTREAMPFGHWVFLVFGLMIACVGIYYLKISRNN